MPKAEVPKQLRQQINVFERWQTDPINLERGERYVRAVQSATAEKHETCILGYLGYVQSRYRVQFDQLSLNAYLEPDKFSQFIAYLKARGVQRGQLVKHVSIARKLADFLQSGTAPASSIRQHVECLDAWLGRLEAQLNASMPMPLKRQLPEAPIVFRWVDRLVNEALRHVEADMAESDSVSWRAAWSTQRALIAALVTGRYIPPCRLDLIKGWVHPRYNGDDSCTDPDCRSRQNGIKCGGNQIQVVEREEAEEVRDYLNFDWGQRASCYCKYNVCLKCEKTGAL